MLTLRGELRFEGNRASGKRMLRNLAWARGEESETCDWREAAAAEAATGGVTPNPARDGQLRPSLL